MLDIEPKKVFEFFYELNQIPRGSGNEKHVSDYLVNFAKKRNLDVIQDEENNVIIRKPASKGYENSKGVILQGHMDMVCVKDEDSDHDFDKDPIDMRLDGDFLKANKTTLGADDGIAVAYAMAILDGDYKHAPLEVLITTSEETGMNGAFAIKSGMLDGKRLLNIDSEEEGEFLVSCAGGARFHAYFPIQREDFDGKALKLTIRGLTGGHSGGEIIKQRANSNKLMARLLSAIRKTTQLRLIKLEGGSKDNAIPSVTKASIVVKDENAAKKATKDLFELFKSEFAAKEKSMELEIEDTAADKPFTEKLTNQLTDYLLAVQDGVVKMSEDMDNLVQTSLNTAVIKEANDKIIVVSSVRSSVESEMDFLLDRMEVTAKAFGAETYIGSRYPGWEYQKDSELRDIAKSTYKQVYGKDAVFTAIHAGVECGLLKKVMPDCDMISYGPDMFDVHSPKERLDVKSAKRVFDYTVKLLENLK